MGKTYTYTPELLEQLRRNAQRMKRDLGIPLNQAQSRIAVEHGFRNWSLLSRQCLATKPGTALMPGVPTSTDTPLAPSAPEIPLQRARSSTTGEETDEQGVVERVLADLDRAVKDKVLHSVAHEGGRTVPAYQFALPVDTLTAAELVAQGKVRMSVAELERAFKKNRFYGVVREEGRAFPAWQFISSVPDVLPDVIAALSEHKTEIHAFMVTAQDDLNELAPAEVLAGMRFVTQPVLEASQERILRLSATQRKERVLEVARDYVEERNIRRRLSLDT